MALAQIGPLTTLTEALATAVGAGVVLVQRRSGSLEAWRWVGSRDEIEERALRGGYFGGGFGAVVALVDVVLRYVIS